MLARVRSYFENESKSKSIERIKNRRVCCAVLMIEVAMIDQDFDKEELNALHEILQQKFKLLSKAECNDLTDLAEKMCKSATALEEITDMVNNNFSRHDKYELVIHLWKIALADGKVDTHEEYLIEKISKLINVCAKDLLHARKVAQHWFVRFSEGARKVTS